MWLLAVFLWTVVVLGSAAADCGLSIQLNGTSGGGRTLLVSVGRSPSCDCPRLELTYQWPIGTSEDAPHSLDWFEVSKSLTTNRTSYGRQAHVTVFLTGWYRVTCCLADSFGPCYPDKVAHARVDGINYTTWNVSISAQQTTDDPPLLSVEVVDQIYPSTNLPGLYLPHLDLRLFNASNLVETVPIVYPENRSYVFGRTPDKRLWPGPYKIKVSPSDLRCGGSCSQSRVISLIVTAPQQPRAVLVSVDTTTSQTVYMVLGVLGGVALCCLVGFLGYSFACGQRGRRWLERAHTVSEKSALPSSPAPAGPVSVLLLHRGGGGDSLDQLRAALRAAGIALLDARERSVLNLMQAYPSPAELLALEPFREARLLFVGGGADGADVPAGFVPARVYDSVLKFVRNGRLGLDYDRVYAATLGDVAGDELAGLVEGRLFRVPADLPALIEHIVCARRPPLARLGSTESQTTLLTTMVPSPVSTDPGSPQPSPV